MSESGILESCISFLRAAEGLALLGVLGIFLTVGYCIRPRQPRTRTRRARASSVPSRDT